MKNNKLLKTLWGVVLVIFMVSIGFLGYSYFKKDEVKKPESNTQTTKKADDAKTDEERYRTRDNDRIKEKENSNSNDTVVEQYASTGEVNSGANTNLQKDTNALVPSEYNGKKLSRSEGLGTTGKVFKTQKEALDYGNSELERLVKEDKKPRQFSISKVTSEDGNLIGWTVDIFEDANGSNRGNTRNN